MACVVDLCRLCMKKDEFAKDLLDEDNKNVLKMIQEFIKIFVCENDNLPTMLCINCEEKIVSFQLFVLECYKAQDILKNTYTNNLNVSEIKLEEKVEAFEINSTIKSEVKDEMTVEDIVCEIHTEASLPEPVTNSDQIVHNVDNVDYLSNVAISNDKCNVVKQTKKKHKQSLRRKVSSKFGNKDKDGDIFDSTNSKINKNYNDENWENNIHEIGGDAIQNSDNSDHTDDIIISTLKQNTRKQSESDDEDFSDNGYEDLQNNDEIDDITIAALKQIKEKQKDVKIKLAPKMGPVALEQLLKKSNLKVRDLIKMDCAFCTKSCKTWADLRCHYAIAHSRRPTVLCLCGFEINSKSVLYKHVSDHKLSNKRVKKKVSDDEESNEKFSNLKVFDFVRFICSECQAEFSSWYRLKYHCEKIHKILPVVSCICGHKIKSKSVMYKHIQDHRNPNLYPCDECPKIRKTLASLNKHKMKHIPKAERVFDCATCHKQFKTNEALKSHERSHLPIEDRKIYHCDICNMKFTTRASAASHKRVVHDKIKSYVCDLCGYACGTNGELRQHRAIHSDDKPFVCGKCSKSFKTYANLKTHMDTHEETSYECYICRRVLNSRRTLRKHLLVHEDKCRHVCCYCNKAFKRRQTLKVHMYTHTGDKPLSCKWCDERFAYASTLRSHRLRCHPDKMAPGADYNAYAIAMQENYIKNDVPTVSAPLAKSEVAAM